MEAQWEAVPFQEERMSRGAALDSSDSGVPFRLPHSLLREALVPLGHFAYMFPQRLVEEVPDVLQIGDDGDVCHGAARLLRGRGAPARRRRAPGGARGSPGGTAGGGAGPSRGTKGKKSMASVKLNIVWALATIRKGSGDRKERKPWAAEKNGRNRAARG